MHRRVQRPLARQGQAVYSVHSNRYGCSVSLSVLGAMTISTGKSKRVQRTLWVTVTMVCRSRGHQHGKARMRTAYTSVLGNQFHAGVCPCYRYTLRAQYCKNDTVNRAHVWMCGSDRPLNRIGALVRVNVTLCQGDYKQRIDGFDSLVVFVWSNSVVLV